MPTITNKAKQAINRRLANLQQSTNEVREVEMSNSMQNASKCPHCATAWAANRLIVLDVNEDLEKLKRIRDILNENT